jgi:uncharacterized protein
MKPINDENMEALESINERGFALLKKLLLPEDCKQIQLLYQDNIYRNTIDMQRYRFGQGEYKYFEYPLPPKIQKLRSELYHILAPIANRWMQALAIEKIFPVRHELFIEQCNAANQFRPTPLILRYEAGGFNTLHQDLYGEVYFPFQVVIVLTKPAEDHIGGELVFVEQVPRAQSKAQVIAPSQGDAVVFTTNFRPVSGTRGYYRANMKHGVSTVHSGVRMALGIIFHDAI